MQKLRLFIFTLLSLAVFSAQAISLFDLRADALMMKLPELKKTLNLTPNQQILWQQSETKTKALLRAKEIRHIKLDDAVRDMVQKPGIELRDVDVRLNEEAQASLLEEQQGHEIWLTMFDALDDKQRELVQEFLYEQLMASGNIEKSTVDAPDTGQRKARAMSHNGNNGNNNNANNPLTTSF